MLPFNGSGSRWRELPRYEAEGGIAVKLSRIV
jgi:hypothetical protein